MFAFLGVHARYKLDYKCQRERKAKLSRNVNHSSLIHRGEKLQFATEVPMFGLSTVRRGMQRRRMTARKGHFQ
jgi:hypothetical protein